MPLQLELKAVELECFGQPTAPCRRGLRVPEVVCACCRGSHGPMHRGVSVCDQAFVRWYSTCRVSRLYGAHMMLKVPCAPSSQVCSTGWQKAESRVFDNDIFRASRLRIDQVHWCQKHSLGRELRLWRRRNGTVFQDTSAAGS